MKPIKTDPERERAIEATVLFASLINARRLNQMPKERAARQHLQRLGVVVRFQDRREVGRG